MNGMFRVRLEFIWVLTCGKIYFSLFQNQVYFVSRLKFCDLFHYMHNIYMLKLLHIIFAHFPFMCFIII